MVLCYLSAGCNYSVCTLLHCAFRDEKGRERGWSQRANGATVRETVLCSRLLLTTMARPEMVLYVREVDLVYSLLKYGYQHENCDMHRAQMNMNKLEVI